MRVACEALAKQLGYLPLALEQAGAFIATTVPRVTFAAYLRLFREATENLLARKALGSTDYPDAVIATWQTTVAKLSPNARAVLRLCAWLADTPISSAYVLDGVDHVAALAVAFGSALPRGTSRAETELQLRDSLSELARYSMILDVTEEGFRLHGLVQAVERIEAKRVGQDEDARDRALDRLEKLFPPAYNDPSAWPLCRQLIPHQQAVVGRFALNHASASLAALLSRAGVFLYGSGEASSALPLLRRALESRERVLGKEHPDALESVNDLVDCLLALGEASSALPLCRRALESSERVLGKEHPRTLASVNSLAGCLQMLGNSSSALSLYRWALESRERVLGKEHPDTLGSVNNLAGCLERRGDTSTALPLYRRALESSERVLGREHPDTLNAVNNLAACLFAQGDASCALPLFRRALESRERVLGKENPQTLISVNNLADYFQSTGDASSALPLFRRALESSEQILGNDHPLTYISANNLAGCLQAMGDASSALPLFRLALENCERVLGREHPHAFRIRKNVAKCRQVLSHSRNSGWWQSALFRLKGWFGSEKP
ncbi:MAG: tetratricopeptide repeat protein [Reyranella sp.]